MASSSSSYWVGQSSMVHACTRVVVSAASHFAFHAAIAATRASSTEQDSLPVSASTFRAGGTETTTWSAPSRVRTLAGDR